MKRTVVLSIALLVLLSSSCSAQSNKPPSISNWDIELDQSWKQQMSERETVCFDFVKNELITKQGGVRTNYLDKAHDPNFASGKEVLSESLGLLMLYSGAIKDKAMFDNLLSYVKNYLDTGDIISYRYVDEDGAYDVNAFIDDMRIIRALIFASDVFEEEYLDIAMEYADRLYATNVCNGFAYDMYDRQYKNKNDFITLCYVDLYTMQLLKAYDARWSKVYDLMLDIEKGGYISDVFPMYQTSYSYSSKTYKTGDVNMIEATLTALNLASIGECPQRTIRYLKENIQNEAIYSSYSQDGKPLSQNESTAIYAICALIAKEAEDEDMYAMCIERMSSLQVMDKTSEVYGAFANPVSLELYSFDNLMALLAYRQN